VGTGIVQILFTVILSNQTISHSSVPIIWSVIKQFPIVQFQIFSRFFAVYMCVYSVQYMEGSGVCSSGVFNQCSKCVVCRVDLYSGVFRYKVYVVEFFNQLLYKDFFVISIL